MDYFCFLLIGRSMLDGDRSASLRLAEVLPPHWLKVDRQLRRFWLGKVYLPLILNGKSFCQLPFGGGTRLHFPDWWRNVCSLLIGGGMSALYWLVGDCLLFPDSWIIFCSLWSVSAWLQQYKWPDVPIPRIDFSVANIFAGICTQPVLWGL
jgi:hypothetical protein